MLFACPECDASYEISDDLSGQDIRCRRCDEQVNLPRKPIKFPPLRVILLALNWLFVIFTVGSITAYALAHWDQQNSSIQQCALAGYTSMLLIANYTTARAIDRLLSYVASY